MKSVVLLCSLLALAGCTKTVEEMSFSEREALADQIQKRCVAQGTVPGTPRHGTCLQVEAQREVHSRRNAPKLEFNPAGGAAAFQAASQGYYNAAARSSSANRSVTCSRVPSPVGYSSVRCY